MRFLIPVNQLGWQNIAIIAGVAIVGLILLAALLNKGRYAARYRAFYKKFDKTITKNYNANLLIEAVVNQYALDRTNTFKAMKGAGKRKVQKYFDYYVKNLPELVVLKSFISSDKNKNQLAILYLNEFDKVIYRWDSKRKASGLIKACNKFQMLTTTIGFLFELPMHLNESLPFRFVNHDNDYVITYEVVKNARKVKSKIKEKKLSRAELKALQKVEAIKAKKDLKLAKTRR
jgi:hypothetical protein